MGIGVVLVCLMTIAASGAMKKHKPPLTPMGNLTTRTAEKGCSFNSFQRPIVVDSHSCKNTDGYSAELPPLYHIYPLDLRFSVSSDDGKLKEFTLTVNFCTVRVSTEKKLTNVIVSVSDGNLVATDGSGGSTSNPCDDDYSNTEVINVSIEKVEKDAPDCKITFDEKHAFFFTYPDITYDDDPYAGNTPLLDDVEGFFDNLASPKCNDIAFYITIALGVLTLIAGALCGGGGFLIHKLKKDIEGKGLPENKINPAKAPKVKT